MLCTTKHSNLQFRLKLFVLLLPSIYASVLVEIASYGNICICRFKFNPTFFFFLLIMCPAFICTYATAATLTPQDMLFL
jgi:hypothetical protein